jgi:arsenate reductase-like glutaredoxin family protein
LRKLEVDVQAVDYAKKPLDEATIRSIVDKAGGVGSVLNTRHAFAKQKGWVDKPPDAATFAKAVAKEPNLLKRPILIADDHVIVGFQETEYSRLSRPRAP